MYMKMIQIFLGVLSFFVIGYYLIIGVYTGSFSGSSIIWLLAGVFFVVLAVVVHKSYYLSKPLITACGTIIFCGLVIFLFLEGLIFSQIRAVPEKDLDYIIVLGAQVRGTKVTKSLQLRLDAAYQYLMENKGTTVVVSGGQGADEIISEAEAMKNYLISKGIDISRIIMEEKSTNTNENIKFSKELMNSQKKEYTTAVVTNDFHVYRAMAIGRKQGLSHIQGIAAKSDPILFINCLVREAMALGKDWIIGNLKLL